MKKRYIVSLISDQPIPNVSFIKHFSNSGDNHIFISSKEYFDKLKHKAIENFCRELGSKTQQIVIDSDRVVSIFKDLNAFNWDKSATYIINITGGNKLMSQAVYTFFMEFKDVSIYYLPIGSNKIQQLLPDINEIELSPESYLTLDEYLACFNYDCQKQTKISKDFKVADNLLTSIIKNRGELKNADVSKYYNYKLSHPDKSYYTGGWLEEWLFESIRLKLNLSENFIAYNVKMKKRSSESLTESDQEIDIMYIDKNILHIIECKYYPSNVKGNKVTTPIHKLNSISKELGLRQTTSLVILGPSITDKNQITRYNDMKKTYGLSHLILPNEIFITRK
ncbi:MAG: DUF1887 family protein [Saprospiraceae bacterium]|nr:DUF1887 family protein [Saprospiraceae bacterium]